MPTQPFVDTFGQWPDNEQLSTERLRLKCISLLALCLMLRPSDLAPKAACIRSGELKNLRLDRIQFLQDGSASIYLHGIKNDYKCDGFRVYLMPASVGKVCPVAALREYLA